MLFSTPHDIRVGKWLAHHALFVHVSRLKDKAEGSEISSIILGFSTGFI